MPTQWNTRRALAGALVLTACVAAAAPKARTVRAQEPLKVGTFKGHAGGGMTLIPGAKPRFELTGGVYIASPTGNIAGDTIVVTMAGRDVETAEATGHVRIVTRQPGDRVIITTGDKGTLNNMTRLAILTGHVTVDVNDPQSPMTVTNVATATIELDTKKVHMEPPAGGQVHFEGTTPAQKKSK